MKVIPRDQHLISRKDISDNALKVIRGLRANGHEAYLVGGAVRDLLLEKVPKDFHSRFSAKMRSYQYYIINRRTPLTLYRYQAWAVFKSLNIDEIKMAAKQFIGKHDFSAFRSADCQSTSSIKTLTNCSVEKNDNNIFLNFSAKSFLHSQVRIIVGTLVEVGKGKILSSDIKAIIESKNRSRAGITAPAHGLYLMKVEY